MCLEENLKVSSIFYHRIILIIDHRENSWYGTLKREMFIIYNNSLLFINSVKKAYW